MKECYELAWGCAKLYSNCVPEIKKIYDMNFI